MFYFGLILYSNFQIEQKSSMCFDKLHVICLSLQNTRIEFTDLHLTYRTVMDEQHRAINVSTMSFLY